MVIFILRFLFLLALFLAGSHAGVARAALDARYDDYEGYPLIQALVDDGKYDLAAEQLNELSKKDKQKPDHFSFWQGVIAQKKNENKQAVSHLTRHPFPAQEPWEQQRHLYLGRAYAELNEHQSCATHYGKIHKLLQLSTDDSIRHAQCAVKTKQNDKVWAVVTHGLAHDTSTEFLSFAAETMAKMGLVHVATTIAMDRLAVHGRSASDFLSVADSFLNAGQTESRLKLLEMARVRFPFDVDVNLALTQIYFEKQMLVAAEEGFARASENDAKYAYHAAELNRQLGRFERSRFFNAKIPDEIQRLKQKLALYVDRGDFAMIASLEPILQRTPLINDDEVRYALAYSLVRSGEYRRPLTYLAKITSRDFLEKTVILRNALTGCVEKNKTCKL